MHKIMLRTVLRTVLNEKKNPVPYGSHIKNKGKIFRAEGAENFREFRRRPPYDRDDVSVGPPTMTSRHENVIVGLPYDDVIAIFFREYVIVGGLR